MIRCSSHPERAISQPARFDSAGGNFGVLYAGLNFEVAFLETLLRNPRRSLVATSEIADRAMTVPSAAAISGWSISGGLDFSTSAWMRRL